MLLDIHATLFYIPIPLFPLTGFCTGGLMKDWGYVWGSVIPYDLYMSLIAFCGAAMNCAFIYRYAAITNNVDWFDKKRTWIFVGLFHVLLAVPPILAHIVAFRMEGTENLIMEYIEKVSRTTRLYLI